MPDYKIRITNAGNLSQGEIATRKTITLKDDCFITNYNPNESAGNAGRDITIDARNGSTQITKGGKTFGTADFNKNIFSLLNEIANLHDDDGNNGNETILSLEDIKKYEKLVGVKNGVIEVAKDFANGVIRFINKSSGSTVLRIDFGEKDIRRSSNNSSVKAGSTAQTTASQAIPQGKVASDENNPYQDYRCVHKVISGDTLSGLAMKYNLFDWELRSANPNVRNWRCIQINQKIKIPYQSDLAKWNNLTATEQEFFYTLKTRESGGEADPYKAEAGSYLGAYQIGPDVLKKLGIMNKDGKWNPNNRFGIKSKQDFFNSPEKQLQVAVASMQNNWDFLTVGNKEDGYNFDVRNYIGTEIEYKGKKYSITQSGVIAAAHLLGPYKVISFLKNPQTKEKMTDGNGTHITEYLLMEGFDLSKMLDIA